MSEKPPHEKVKKPSFFKWRFFYQQFSTVFLNFCTFGGVKETCGTCSDVGASRTRGWRGESNPER